MGSLIQVPRFLRSNDVHGSAFNGGEGNQGRGESRAAFLEEVVMGTQVGLQSLGSERTLPRSGFRRSWSGSETTGSRACLISFLG